MIAITITYWYGEGEELKRPLGLGGRSIFWEALK